MASDTIPQMAEKIREFAEGLIRDNFATCSPPAPQTYTAERALKLMGQGRECYPQSRGPYSRCYLNGEGRVAWTQGNDTYNTNYFVDGNRGRYLAGDIHASAHTHALQRLLKAGLKVGSRVEVVDVDGGGSLGRACIPKYYAGKTRVVEEVLDGDRYLNVTAGGWHYPAHCLKLIQAKPEAAYTPPPSPPGSVWWAIDKMRGGAVCERDGHKHRIRDGVLEWFIFDKWKGICLCQDNLASTEWRVVEGGSQ